MSKVITSLTDTPVSRVAIGRTKNAPWNLSLGVDDYYLLYVSWILIATTTYDITTVFKLVLDLTGFEYLSGNFLSILS